MKRYITSDKVGEFVQTLYKEGFKMVMVQQEQISVKLSNDCYEFIDIYNKCSYDALLDSIYMAEKKAIEDSPAEEA